jgi:hypothetical protein
MGSMEGALIPGPAESLSGMPPQDGDARDTRSWSYLLAVGALVKADAEKWWPTIRELGIKAE